MRSDRAGFKPTPGMIRDNAPQSAKDKPRKVKNTDCPDCRDTGFRMIQVDSIIHPGKKANRVTDCFCVRIEYNGESYMPEQRQLPSALDSARSDDVQTKIDIVAKGKAMPAQREQTEADYRARHNILAQQAERLKEGK